MTLRNARPDAATIVASAGLALGGFLFLRFDNPDGWWLLFASGSALALAILRPALTASTRPTDLESIDLTSWGVRRFDRQGRLEAVSWDDLSEVSVTTTPDGDDGEDVHIQLTGRDAHAVRVAHTVAVESGLLAELATRLRAFDNEAMVDALTYGRDSIAVLWRAPSSARHDRPMRHRRRVPIRAAS